jgi:hypothetical protein
MFKKILIVLMIGCFLLGMATKAEVESVKEEGAETPKNTVTETLAQPENETEKGYRIEVSKVNLRGKEEEIRFISPEGNVVRTIPYGIGAQKLNFRISPASNFVVNTRVEDLSEAEAKEIREQMKLSSGRVDRLNLAYIDKTGKEGWVKEFLVESVDSETFPSYGIEFSKDGSRILLYKNHKLGYSSYRCDITILDTLGREIVSRSVNNMIEGGFQIASDGKIVGAPIYKDSGKYLIFIDVEDNRTKVVKAEGEVNGKKWSASPSLLKNKKIYLSGGWHYIDEAQSAITSFDEIPSDLTTLFEVEK